MSALVAKDVSVAIDGRVIVERLSLRVEPGEWLGIIGPNGAGKTTLLRALAGVVPSRGRIEIDGSALGTLRPKARARRVAMVAQHPVIPEAITVTEYVMLGRTPHLARFALPANASLTRLSMSGSAGDQPGSGSRRRGTMRGRS